MNPIENFITEDTENNSKIDSSAKKARSAERQNETLNDNSDRNFDEITAHFAKKVYGGLKGDIRLTVLRRDLEKSVSDLSKRLQRPLRILDIGAGLAQLSLELAHAGHDVTINDISINMLTKAKELNAETLNSNVDNDAVSNNLNSTVSGIVNNITWLVGPYQDLDSQLTGKYDLILCHALLEWLDKPQDIMPFFEQWLSDEGVLSLCFYNPASFVYRNLIMGNFNLLNNPDYKADNKKSLTPNNPVSFDEVTKWLDGIGMQIESVSGLRVFHDYTPLKRGGHQNPADVIEMEVRYSNQAPFKWLGRYLHVLALFSPLSSTSHT